LAYYQYTSFYPAEGQTTNNGYCYIDPIASHLPTRNNSETTVKMSQNFTLLRASKDTLIPNFTDLNLKYTSVQGTNYNIQMFCISQREITVADLNAYLGANLVVDLQSAEEILKDWQQAHTPVELR
ncbi:MAG TPA: hypothetical protein VN132_11435, partial [Bdellovibrio sp.]|nr:hypothetical protein [Bdellovibrio sp.]